MYIKKLILDGFKSYGKRTEIDGFDKEFTAITGLNGTGKSNILDAICFVLGISNLTQVRVGSLQELVYKNGQAGITKASVSIIFDNTDKNNFPVGYESCKEIIISRQVCVGGGKNKYFINGRTVLNKKVIDLFCSIQMNVNNPHFLIMQGRITKVLNMKPMEILSMIEEASGTSLYETKREQTTKVLEKKDSKIKEMNSLLAEEIIPRIEKLRDELKYYVEFQKLVRDIDHLTHIHISYTYLQCKKNVQNCEKAIESAVKIIEDNTKEIEDNKTEVATIENECEEMQALIDAETGGKLAKLETELATKSKTLSTANGAKLSAGREVDAEQRKLKLIRNNIARDEECLRVKEAEREKVGGLFQSLKEADEADSKAFADAQKRLQAASSGLETNKDGQAASLQEQLIAGKTRYSELTTAIKRSEMELQHTTRTLNEKQNSKMSSDASYQKNKQNLDKKEAEIKTLTQKLSQIQYDHGALEHLEERKSILNNECKQLESEISHKGAHRFQVDYKDPEPNFNRRTVKGMICKLFDVRDPKYHVALSACGGGSLYNLVVDDEIIAKKIINHGQLQKRITIIPITKIAGGCISADRVKFAQRLVGAENCIPAIDLITYPPELKKVMEYVYGRCFICTNMSVAKQVTYHRQILTPSITLDGDFLEPAGTLSGGATSNETPVLLLVAEIKEITRRLEAKRLELRQIHAEISKTQPIARSYMQLKQQLDAAEYEMNSIKQLLAKTTYQKHQQEIEDAKAKIENLKQAIAKAADEQKAATTKIKEIETNLADAKGYRDRQLKEAADNMQKLKAKSEKSRNEWKKHEQEAETLQLEIDGLKETIEKSKESVAASEENFKLLSQKLDELVKTSELAFQEIDTLKAQINEQKESINAKHQESRKKLAHKRKLLKKNDDLALQVKKKESEMNKIKSDNKDGYDRIAALEHEYKWIETDREFFGGKNTKYDYSKENPVESGDKLRVALEKRSKMEKRINVKAMMLLEREEEKLKDVCSRKTIVENDRKKIKGILEGLDAEKMEQLRKAWEEIDKNFGNIFSVLLPGAEASLVPSAGQQFYQGLNIKVGFNGVWKESLNELSGGQRSLVALSLILAMLKYKPAPIYILDEVDAALDMSHTQNIGNMLKLHFKNSQFIIVSLKDGMFNNANVLFKTKFENGLSGVTRTANAKR